MLCLWQRGRNWGFTLAEPGRAAELRSSLRVSANFFNVLRVAILGRTFGPDEDDATRDRVGVLTKTMCALRGSMPQKSPRRQARHHAKTGSRPRCVSVVADNSQTHQGWAGCRICSGRSASLPRSACRAARRRCASSAAAARGFRGRPPKPISSSWRAAWFPESSEGERQPRPQGRLAPDKQAPQRFCHYHLHAARAVGFRAAHRVRQSGQPPRRARRHSRPARFAIRAALGVVGGAADPPPHRRVHRCVAHLGSSSLSGGTAGWDEASSPRVSRWSSRSTGAWWTSPWAWRSRRCWCSASRLPRSSRGFG